MKLIVTATVTGRREIEVPGDATEGQIEEAVDAASAQIVGIMLTPAVSHRDILAEHQISLDWTGSTGHATDEELLAQILPV